MAELENSLGWVDLTLSPPGSSAHKGMTLGYMLCHCCGAKATVTLDKGLKAYSYCNGRADEKQCGAAIKWPRAASQKLIAAWAKQGGNPANENPLPSPEIEEPTDDGESTEPTETERDEPAAPTETATDTPGEPANPAGDPDTPDNDNEPPAPRDESGKPKRGKRRGLLAA